MPPLSQKDFDDPGGYMSRAYDLLVRANLEHGFAPDYAHSMQVSFPSGDKGVFVSIGLSGVTRGYLILLRLKGNDIEPFPIVRSDYDWGSIDAGQLGLQETRIESMELFHSPIRPPGQIVKVSGWSHMGTGISSDAFQLVQITDDGLRVIFTGVLDDLVAVHRGHYNEYGYDYVDLDGDGDKEIVQIGRECEVQYVQEPPEPEISNCSQVRRAFKYNGTEYVQLP